MVRIAGFAVGEPPEVLLTAGLGSCIAAVLYDERAGIGGMVHILLPEPPPARPVENPFKFAATGIPQLILAMCEAGATRGRLTARLAGGARMFAGLSTQAPAIGERNLAATRAALAASRVPVVAEDVGGEWGRTVHFDLAAGRMNVSSVLRADVVL